MGISNLWDERWNRGGGVGYQIPVPVIMQYNLCSISKPTDLSQKLPGASRSSYEGKKAKSKKSEKLSYSFRKVLTHRHCLKRQKTKKDKKTKRPKDQKTDTSYKSFDIFVWSLMRSISKNMTFIWLNLHARGPIMSYYGLKCKQI